MYKITRDNTEIELTEKEIDEIIKRYVGLEERTYDNKRVYICTIKRASQIIARGFIDGRTDVYSYDTDITDKISFDNYDQRGVVPYIVTTHVASEYIQEDRDDLVALCANRGGGNYTMAYCWRCEYTDAEAEEAFEDEICRAMCDSCGESKDTIIYLKEGMINDRCS